MATPKGKGNRRPAASKKPLPLWGKVLSVAGALGLLAFGAFIAPIGRRVVDDVFPASAVSSAATTDPVVVNTRWPFFRYCDASTAIAVPNGGTKPDQVGANSDTRQELVSAGSAVFGRGTLYITLSVTDDRVVSVTDIRPVIFKKRPAEAAWIYEPAGGCGDHYTRTFALDLDTPLMQDLGVDGPTELAPKGVVVPTQPVGQAFTVDKTDPVEIVVMARGCHAYYEWGVKLTYLVDGRTITQDIGTAAKPFRSIGILAETPVYLDAEQLGLGTTGLVKRATDSVPIGCTRA